MRAREHMPGSVIPVSDAFRWRRSVSTEVEECDKCLALIFGAKRKFLQYIQ